MTRDDIIRKFLDLHPDTPIDDKQYAVPLWVIRRMLETAEAAERKKWEPVIAGVMREVPWQLKSSKKGNAPGHAHEVVGIWDSDNGELAGTQCAWCKAWNTALNIIEERKQS